MSADLAVLKIRVDALEARAAEKDLDRLTAAGSRAERQAASSGVAWGRLSGLLSTLGIGILAREFVKVNTEFQRLQAILATVEGGVSGAAVAFKTLEKLAVDLPFTLGEVTDAYIQLKARGLDAGAQSITNYANIAAAFGKDINYVVQGVTSALAGRMEILEQLGLQIVQNNGKVTASFKGQTETFTRSAKNLEDYLGRLAQNNFGDAAARQMQTLGGATSNLEDAFQALLRSAGAAGGGGLLVGMIRDLTEWLGRAKDRMNELGQDQTFQRLMVEVGNTVQSVQQLTGDIVSLGGAMGDAGVKGGAFVRVLQGVQLALQGVRAIVQGTATLYAYALEMMASQTLKFITVMQQFPNVAKAMGFTPEMVDQAKQTFVGMERWAQEFGSKSADSFGDAWDQMLDRFADSDARATAAVLANRKAAQDALAFNADGTSSAGGTGYGSSAKTPLSQGEVSKIREAQNALREWGIESLKTLGLIDDEQEKVGKLIEKIKVLGALKIEQVKSLLHEIESRKELAKEMEFAAALESRRLAVARQVEAQDRQSADAIRDLSDPYRQYRLRLQEINELLDQNLISERQAGIARATALAAVSTDVKSPAQEQADELARLAALYRGGALSADRYRQKVVELGMQGTSAIATLGQAMERVSSGMESAFVQLATTGKFQFKDMVSSILADMARLAANRAFSQFLQMGLGYLFGASGGGTFNAAGTGATGGSGYGSAMAGLAPGSTQEAPQISTTITVNVQEGTAKSDTQTSGKGGVDLGRLIDAKVRGVLMDEMRPNGLLNPGRA